MNLDFIDFNFIWNFELIFTWRSVLGIAIALGLIAHWFFKRNKRTKVGNENDVKGINDIVELDYEKGND